MNCASDQLLASAGLSIDQNCRIRRGDCLDLLQDFLKRAALAHDLFKHRRLVDLLRKIGERHKATPAQVALAWLLARKPWIVPLFGTRKLERFEENIGALAVRLTDGDVRELNDSRTTMPVHGNRYPEEHMRRVGL